MSLRSQTIGGRGRGKDLLARLVLLFGCSYGLLYFSYKYLIPWSGTDDFRHYYPMYLKPLDFSVAPGPWVLRQVSAVLTHMVWRAGIYYPNKIWFQDAAYDQHVFFAALFTNWVCLVVAGLVAGMIAEEMLGVRSFLGALLAGLFCLLSFHSQFVVISGITEGVSWLMLALAFLAYLRRAEWAVLLILALAVLQREALLVGMAAIAGFDLIRHWNAGQSRPAAAFRLRLIAYSLVGLAVYVSLRRLVPGNSHQVHLEGIIASLREVRFTRAMLTLSFLNQNIVLIAVAVRLLVRRKVPATEAGEGWVVLLLCTFAVIALGALCAGLDVDIGRIAGITIPLFAASAAADIMRLNRPETSASPTELEPVPPPGTGRVLGR